MLVVYVHPEKEWESTLRLINDTSPYGLTGSVFACNRDIVQKSCDMLKATSTSMTSPRTPLWDSSHLAGQGFRLVGLSGRGFRWVGLSGWSFK